VTLRLLLFIYTPQFSEAESAPARSFFRLLCKSDSAMMSARTTPHGRFLVDYQLFMAILEHAPPTQPQ